ncbi:MAG: hypothetical protein ACUVRH_02130 [Candidatus Bipolaricaulia bacterium]
MNGMIPEEFIAWVYRGRAELVRRQARGEVQPHELLLGFARHTPAVVSYGPAGLNAAIKGVGFLPKPGYLQETINAYLEHIDRGWRDGYREEGLQLLIRFLYCEGCEERLDFTKLGSLELARGHSWGNLRANPKVTLIFYQPPNLSYEVRGRAEIHEEGPLHLLINAQHDVYHYPDRGSWAARPAYVFSIDEIYDNSAREGGFGRRIY